MLTLHLLTLRETNSSLQLPNIALKKMDPDSVKSTLSNLAFGNVMAAAARDYQKKHDMRLSIERHDVDLILILLAACCLLLGRISLSLGTGLECFFPLVVKKLKECYEVLSQQKAQASNSINQEVDLDELMDDPELERLHADRIASLKKEAEKRQALKKQGHGEYREVTEADFLGEVTGSEKVICHFYHREFYRCKIMDKHLKSLAPRHMDTKIIKLDAENAPFFVAKLGVKTLPCVILFRKGIAVDRLIGFQDMGGKDDFATRTLEALLIKKGIVSEKKKDEDDEDRGYPESRRNTVRSSVDPNSDSD
ncbi:Thioredoxin domain-containing protein PLP3B [Vitis vinifera]|uniref:Thioredoxin domain-containing protein PLP3B n=1 Tax=Vitis vinifera TaxID=29760 RepID=A0A438J9Q9_VITVI|nr:Thioredoxin domain-containing protein PLP3B [Vitis vinifera]